MAIVSDQFFVIDPGNPPAANTALTVQVYDLNDIDDDGFITTGNGDLVNGLTVTSVFVGDRIRVQWPDGSTQWIEGVTFYFSGGPAVFTPTDGTILQNATFLESTWVPDSTQVALSSLTPACFTPGTLIETDHGLRLIETLQPGDLVRTLDHGFQPLRWVSVQTVQAIGPFAPVHIAAGAMGNARPLVVSQQHRMLLQGWQAQLHFAEDQVLVAAKHLVNNRTITIREGGMVTYVHLLFDRHEIVFGEGIASESYCGTAMVAQEDTAQQAELRALFPDLVPAQSRARPVARPVLRGYEAALLAA